MNLSAAASQLPPPLDLAEIRRALAGIPGLDEARMVDDRGGPQLYVVVAEHDAIRDDRVIEALLALDLNDMHFVPRAARASIPDGVCIA